MDCRRRGKISNEVELSASEDPGQGWDKEAELTGFVTDLMGRFYKRK